MGFIPYILIAILILLAMITIHELGHYIAGSVLKFKITEFAIGFGPVIGIPKFWDKNAMARIRQRAQAAKEFNAQQPGGENPLQDPNAPENIGDISRDYLFRLQWVNKKKEKISIRLLPLGGYCAFKGEDDGTEGIDSFNSHKPWQRLIVQGSGAVFNIVSALIFSIIFIAVIGFSVPQVNKIYDTSVNAGILQEEDTIVSVNGKDVSVLNGFSELMAGSKAGDVYEMTIIRNGKEIVEQVTISEYTVEVDGETVTNTGIGIGITWQPQKLGFFETIGTAFPFTGKLSVLILKSFGDLLTGKIPLNQIGGPVTTIRQMGEMTQDNFSSIFILLPLLAANLGIFNLFPIPALDGARMVFTTIEWVRGKPVNRNVEAWIHFCGFILLLGSVLLVDFLNIFFL